ncbi:MAG TPA: hypothetical protein VGE04_03890 [Chloroflexia bacterium]
MIRFTYKFDEHGWATAHISDSVNELTIHPSRVTGSGIEDLADKVVALLRADREGISTTLRCSWGDEPGEYRWVLENHTGSVRIYILWFDIPWSHLADDKGEVLFSTECSLLKFAIQVKTELRAALDTLGEVEYKQRVRRDFPQRTYDELKSLVREEQLRLKAANKRQ